MGEGSTCMVAVVVPLHIRAVTLGAAGRAEEVRETSQHQQLVPMPYL